MIYWKKLRQYHITILIICEVNLTRRATKIDCISTPFTLILVCRALIYIIYFPDLLFLICFLWYLIHYLLKQLFYVLSSFSAGLIKQLIVTFSVLLCLFVKDLSWMVQILFVAHNADLYVVFHVFFKLNDPFFRPLEGVVICYIVGYYWCLCVFVV